MIENIYILEFNLELVSGLHIGGSSENFDIGGADSNVIKNPLTKEPYIPGSSLKGKLRSLLEYKYGKIDNKKILVNNKEIKNLFEPVENENKVSITRAIFRDLYLSDESKEKIQSMLGLGQFTEVKAENKIDRIKGSAENPRFIERVPAGAVFKGEIILTIYEGDDKEELKTKLLESLNLLEVNYLGGSGTRGYGKVKIIDPSFVEVEMKNENL